MRLKLSLQRSLAGTRDIVVTTDASATVGAVARVIAEREPGRGTGTLAEEPTLAVQFPGSSESAVLAPETPIGEAPIASGASVTVAAPRAKAEAAAGPVLAVLRVVEGPDTGKEFPLRAGSAIIGRDAGADIPLDDDLVSRRHARVEVGATVDLVDLNSANGIVVDGVDVTRVSLQSGQTALIGGTLLRAELVAHASPSGIDARTGTVLYNRAPLVEPRYPGTEYEGPEVPRAIEPIPIPWVALAAPLVMGIAFTFTPGVGASRFLFIALSPLILIGTVVSQRVAKRRKHRLTVAAFDEQLGHLQSTLAGQVEPERTVRLIEAPATEELVNSAITLGPGLWARRPEHWSFANVRLGIGTAPSRNTVVARNSSDGLPDFVTRLDAVIDEYRAISGVPIVENFSESGAIGIAGAEGDAADAARSILVQLAGLYSPSEVAFVGLLSPVWSQQFDWLKWLPHVGSAQSPLGSLALADTSASGTVMLSALEELVEARMAKGPGPVVRGPQRPADAVMLWGAGVGEDAGTNNAIRLPNIVLFVSVDAPVDRARLIQLTEKAADAGILPVWIGPSVDDLPAACRTWLDVAPVGSPSTVGFVRQGVRITDVEVSRIDAARALEFARNLSGVVDAGAIESDDSDLPRSVSFVSLLGPELAKSSAAVVERWRENDSIANRTPGAPLRKRRAGKLRAIVGQGAIDAMHLDLRSQGPHALVGGTTGAGKSEFLQAWVLGMAAEYSPDRVTFLFVDYKGGSAFAECVQLPHCVGLVTDLSPHLVRRALTSLRAELHYREHLFNRKKVKDLLELEKSGDPETPPALVLVFDEFAALVGDVPEFVDGVVDIAQRGRSLGIHLIMATQRPAGVIRDNLRANTNLRIALRMADETDSTDVVGDKIAGTFDPSIPGRAIAKTGPGRLTTFQSGYAGGWTSDEPAPPSIDVADLRFGVEQVWEQAKQSTVAPVVDQGPTDQTRLVRAMIAASKEADIPKPRRPWLDELATAFDLTRLTQRTDTELVLGVSDIPEAQRQDQVSFRPDVDGNIAIYGAGGSGKSVALRSLAAAAGITPRGGPVDVYGLDFGTGGLRMLEVLPHVGAIVGGDDPERVVRLLRMLRSLVEDRSARYSAVNAGTIVDYRRIAGKPDEPRVLLLVDNFPAFRAEYEATPGRAPWYGVFQQLLGDGRALGIHVAITVDRPGSVPTAVSSAIQRRVVLRLADEAGYVLLDSPVDVLSPISPPGRALLDGFETQVAIVGGSSSVSEQSRAMASLGEAMRRAGRSEVPGIGALSTEIPTDSLPPSLDGKPVLGVADDSLSPVAFEPSGVLLLAGPPASGRTTALGWLADSVSRAEPNARKYYIGNPRSPLATRTDWVDAATALDDVVALAKELAPLVAAAPAPGAGSGRIVVVIEQLADFLSSPADSPLVELIKAIKRSDHFLIADSETTQWASSWPLLTEVKSARTGFLLQPDGIEGDTILRTTLPRVTRSEFPVGRGYLIARGRSTRVQLPLPGAAS